MGCEQDFSLSESRRGATGKLVADAVVQLPKPGPGAFQAAHPCHGGDSAVHIVLRKAK